MRLKILLITLILLFLFFVGFPIIAVWFFDKLDEYGAFDYEPGWEGGLNDSNYTAENKTSCLNRW